MVNDLSIFLRLLARSARGSRSPRIPRIFMGRSPGGELHIVLVDNGRSEILLNDEFRRSLNCIRCGACMNTARCTVAAAAIVTTRSCPARSARFCPPPPTPRSTKRCRLRAALCGSCTDCLPGENRSASSTAGLAKRDRPSRSAAFSKTMSMKLARVVLRNPVLYKLAGWLGRTVVPRLPRFLVYNRLNGWGKRANCRSSRKSSFREQFRNRKPTSRDSRDKILAVV